MFKNKIYIYLIKAGIDEKCWTFDKPIAFLSTCHPELVGLDDIFLFAKSEVHCMLNCRCAQQNRNIILAPYAYLNIN